MIRNLFMRWRLAKELDIISNSNRKQLHYILIVQNRIKGVLKTNDNIEDKLKEIKSILIASDEEFESLIINGLSQK
ncbi:MAG: hypothetical protein K8R54_04310 [Bacteroidales bacterium]|nr:hypothetical protein [Bacteroidales bacterium]